VHQLSPAHEIDGATFGCGTFVGVGQSSTSTANFISSTSGTTWTTAAAPIDATSHWSAVGYGAHRFVAVDASGNIAWSSTSANCSAAIPTSPRQVSGNINNGKVWTYMHPPSSAGGAPVNSYRVNISTERSSSSVRHRCTLNPTASSPGSRTITCTGSPPSRITASGIRHRLTGVRNSGRVIGVRRGHVWASRFWRRAGGGAGHGYSS